MTIDELKRRLEPIGFLVYIEELEGVLRVLVSKLAHAPGHRLAGDDKESGVDGPTAPPVVVNGPSPFIKIEHGVIDYSVTAAVPSSPGAYSRPIDDLDELYEEILHYYFDADSPMSKEPGFVPGRGRPTSA